MKTTLLAFLLLVTQLLLSAPGSYAAGSVTVGTTAVAAADLNQGTNTNVVYIASMAVSTENATVNNIQFTLSGSHDADDLSTVSIYFNASSPVISGASFIGSAAATFAGPHAYSINVSRTVTAGTTGYFLITVNVTSSATDNHTIRITGSTTPVTFSFSTSTSVTNNQNNGAGILTIQAADVTLTTSAVTAASINQGTNTNVVYITKMDVTTEPVTANNIQFTLSGDHDNDDLSTVSVYFNATSPVISGASFIGSAAATFAAPHLYSINISRTLAAGTSGYFLITMNVTSGATDNHTVVITGNTTPVTFGYTTVPNVTNQQTNIAGAQTIQAADVTLSTSTVAAANLNQGTNTNIVYITKMDVATEPVTANNIQFTLSGNHDNDDLSTVSVYFNATAPVISGASFIGSAAANFAAPHAYSINISRTLAAGTTGYFLITINVNSTATDNHVIQINGKTTPVTFGYTTAPNILNKQKNLAGPQTIQAADIILTTEPVAAANLNQGTNTNIVYITKMAVSTEPVTANNIQFTLSGNHDNDDLSTVSVYFNATAPVISGASFIGSAAANFAAPHAYSINISRTLAAATSGYFLITVNVTSSATDNRTIRITGNTTPVTFGYTTAPNILNQQNNGGGLQTIQAADVSLTTSPVADDTIFQGTNTNVVYIVKMDVATEPVTANNIQFTLSGTQDNDDLSTVSVYFNATSPVISGASFIGSSAANFAAPHAYSINISRTLAAATSGYFLITVNVISSATDNHNIRITGSTTPVTFGYTTTPNVVNSQNNSAGLQSIQAADITLTTSAIAAGNIVAGTNTNIVYIAKMDVLTASATANNIQFTLSGTQDNDDLSTVSVYFNATSPVISGASFIGSTAANFAAPHAYSINISRTLAAATSGYFLITVNVTSTASIGKTVQVNGSTNPVTFGYTTTPNVTNSQTNGAGVKTISASLTQPVSSVSTESAITAGNQNTSLSVYPNPANSVIHYSIASSVAGKITVQLFDGSGRMMVARNEVTVTGRNQFMLNVSSLSNGIYHMVVVNSKNNTRLTQEIKIQH